MGRNSSAGIATRYGLAVRGSNSNGARFSEPVQIGPGVHTVYYTRSIGSFPGVKWPRRGVDYPPM